MMRHILGTAALLFACSSTQPLSEIDIWPISFRRTPCFGPCSAYNVVFYTNGRAKMKLVRAQDGSALESLNPGEYTGTFQPEAVDAILPILSALDYFSLDSIYDDPRVMDLPAVETTIAGKRVYNRFQGPDLNALYFELDSMVFGVNWTPLKDN